MKQAFFWFLNRLQERSTWLGLISLTTAFGFILSPEQAEAIVALGLAFAGAVGVFSKDKQKEKQ